MTSHLDGNAVYGRCVCSWACTGRYVALEWGGVELDWLRLAATAAHPRLCAGPRLEPLREYCAAKGAQLAPGVPFALDICSRRGETRDSGESRWGCRDEQRVSRGQSGRSTLFVWRCVPCACWNGGSLHPMTLIALSARATRTRRSHMKRNVRRQPMARSVHTTSGTNIPAGGGWNREEGRIELGRLDVQTHAEQMHEMGESRK